MINEIYSLAISETLYYLKGIQQQDIDKIPNKFMNFLKDNCLKNYKCNFDYTRPLKELNISDEARGLIAMICLNYWCDNEEKKEMFKKYLAQNEIKYQEKLREKYNPDELFKKKKIDTVKENENKEEINNLPIEVKKERFYEKIINFFKKIFHIG